VSVERQDNGERWTFDAVPTEDYKTSISTTSHPVEEGAKYTDHAEEDPKLIDLQGVVSENPKESAFRSNANRRTLKAVEFFEGLVGVRVRITSQDLGTFENLLLTGYPHKIDASGGTVIRASFEQIKVAESRQVDIPPEQPPEDKSPEISDEQELGKKGTNEPGRFEKSRQAGKDAAEDVGV